jgi:hypothetical protein
VGARFAGEAVFFEARFASVAGFAGATFVGDALFGRAQFAGVARFDSAMTFARQEPEDACWVRLDVPDEVAGNRSWPARSAEVRLAEHPAPDANGEWGRLVYQAGPDPS